MADKLVFTSLPFYHLFENGQQNEENEIHLTNQFLDGSLGILLQNNVFLVNLSSLHLVSSESSSFLENIKKLDGLEDKYGLEKKSTILISIDDPDLQDLLHGGLSTQDSDLIEIYVTQKILFILPKYYEILGSKLEMEPMSFFKRVKAYGKSEFRRKRAIIESIKEIRRNLTFRIQIILELFNNNLSGFKDLVDLLGSKEEVFGFTNNLYLEVLNKLKYDNLIDFDDKALINLQNMIVRPYTVEKLNSELESDNAYQRGNLEVPYSPILETMNEKPKILNKVFNASKRLKRKERDDEVKELTLGEEVIMGYAQSQLKLKNAKYRSNASMRSGKLVLTDKRILAYHRKFSLFPTIPFFAYVRINNRVLFIIQQIVSFFSSLRPIISGIARSIGPAIAALFFAFAEDIDFNSPKFLNPVSEIPVVKNFIKISAENPRFLASILSVLGGLSYGFVRLIRIFFYRSRAISVIEYSMVLGLSTQNKFFRTKSQKPVILLKPKGSDMLPGLSNGLPFRLNLRSRSIGMLPGALNDELFAIKIGLIPYF